MREVKIYWIYIAVSVEEGKVSVDNIKSETRREVSAYCGCMAIWGLLEHCHMEFIYKYNDN